MDSPDALLGTVSFVLDGLTEAPSPTSGARSFFCSSVEWSKPSFVA